MAALIYIAIIILLAVPIGRVIKSHLPDETVRNGWGELQTPGKDMPALISLIAVLVAVFWPVTVVFGLVYLGISKGGK